MSKDWSKVQLGHYVNELSKSKHLSGSSDESGIYDFYVCSPIKQKSKFFDRDDTAVMLSTGGEFSVHLTRGKYAYSSDVWGLQGKDALTTEFLFRWFELYKERLNYKGFQGSGIQHLDKDYCRTRTLRLPEIEEQQKIAEILTAVDEVIENTQSQINKLEDLKKATMNELLTKGIGHTEFKETEIGRIPKDWEVCTLEELSEYRRGSFPQPYGLPKWFSESGYPFVQVFDISDNGRLKESTKEKISDLAAEKSVFVKKGSLIVSLQGSIGRIAITHYDAYVDRTILIFTKFHRPIDLTYFSEVIERLFGKKKDEADGGVIKTITKETLSNFQVALPPIEEQRRISSVLRDHSDRIADLRQKYIGLRNLKVSLMQDLLTGKVRVTVN